MHTPRRARPEGGTKHSSSMWVSATARAAGRCTWRPCTMVPTMINTHRSYKTISTPNAPSAIGPYSQAVVHNGLAFVSGCIPFDPQTMQCVDGGVEAQAQRALDNLMAVVAAAGSDKSQVLKTTVFLKDMNDFAKVNVRLLVSPQAIYEKAFAPYKPARSAVEVARLPRDVLVEVECIAAARE